MSAGYGAGHEKNVADRVCLRDAIGPGLPYHALELLGAFERYDLRARMQGDVGSFDDTANEIVGHAVGQPFGADQELYLPAPARKIDRCLARRIAAADHDHFLHLAAASLRGSRRVIDTGTEKARRVFQGELAILRSGCDDDHAPPHRGPKPELDHIRPLTALQLQRRVSGPDFGAELLRLHAR